MKYKLKPRKEIHELVTELQKEIEAITPLIVLCGEGPCDEYSYGELLCEDCEVDTRSDCLYDLRINLKDRLNREVGCLATIFGENADGNYASMDEKLILRKEVDLVFIIPTSEGSISEASSFNEDDIIKPKLRLLIPYEFHPFYGTSTSYLTSFYKEMMSEYGHVYPFDLTGERHPEPFDIASTLIEVYKRRKLLEINSKEQ